MVVAVLAAVAAGAFIAVQSALIGGFGTRTSGLAVALWVHVAGLVTALVAVVLVGDGFGLRAVREFPVGLLAGVAGVGIVSSIAVAVTPIGLAATLAIVTGVQLLLAFALEAAGLLGPTVRLDAGRILGALLIVAGVLLVFGRRSV